MIEVKNKIQVWDCRLPIRDKLLDDVKDYKNDKQLIYDFGWGFLGVFGNLASGLKEGSTSTKGHWTKEIINIIVPKFMSTVYYNRNKSKSFDNGIEDFYNVGENAFNIISDMENFSDLDHDIADITVTYNHRYLMLHKVYDFESLPKNDYDNSANLYEGELAEDIIKIAKEILEDLKNNPNPKSEGWLY